MLGLFWRKPEAQDWSAEVLALVAERELARKSKNWKQADALRDQLSQLGVAVEDGAEGPKIRRR